MTATQYPGLQPSPLDTRDYLYASGITALPEESDLTPWVQVVRDQIQTSACSGMAAVGAMEILSARGGKPIVLSPAHLYANERRDDGMYPLVDQGVSLRQALKSASVHGVCRESIWPFDPSRINDIPPPGLGEVFVARFESCGSKTQDSLNALKASLSEGFPVIIGLNLSGQIDALRPGDVYTGTQPGSTFRGHGALAVGHNNRKGTIRVLSSWSDQWCDGGYFDLPYEVYLRDVYESWACTALEGLTLTPLWIAPIKNTRIYLDDGITYTMTNSGCSVIGAAVPNTLIVKDSVRNIRVDSNVKTMHMPSRLATKLEFLQIGTTLEIHQGGLLLVSWTVNDDVMLQTSDFPLPVHIGIIDGSVGMTVQGQLISKVVPTPLGGFP